MDQLSPTLRNAIAFGASRGVAHKIFGTLTPGIGPNVGFIAAIVITVGVTYAIYRALGLPLRREHSST